MKTPLLLCLALTGCLDQTDQPELAATDQAIDSQTRDRVFSIGQGGTTWTQVQTAANSSTFSGFEALGVLPDGTGLTKIASERNLDGRLSVFAVGTDTRLYGRYQTAAGGGWNPEGWQPMGGGFIKQMATARNQDGRIELFVLNTLGNVFHRFQVVPNGGWNSDGWEPMSGAEINVQQIAALKQSTGRIEIVALDSNGAAFHRVQVTPNGGWDAGFTPIGPSLAGAVLTSIALVNANNIQMHLIALDSRGDIEEALETSNTTWSPFTKIASHLGPQITSIVVGRLFDFSLTVIATDATHRGLRLTQNTNTSPPTWDGPFFHVVNDWDDVAQFAVANEASGGLTVFERKNSDNSLWAATQNVFGAGFFAKVPLGGIQFDIAAIDQQ